MQNESSSQQRQSWLGGLFGGSRRKQKRASVAITHSATNLPSPQIDAYEGSHGTNTDNNTVHKPDPSVNRKLAPSPFALKTPGGSSLLKKREKKQKKKTRGTSWPLASKGGSASSTTTATTSSPVTTAAASASAGSNGSLNSNTRSSSTTTISTIDEDRAIMGGGSAPTSPLGSSPGLALASLSLGNPKMSSLHRRRHLRLSLKKMSRFVEQPLGRGGVQERSPGHAQPWSPRTCLHLNATPPDSPVWGFGTTVPSPTTTTTTTTTTTSSAAATTSPNVPPATATTTATTTLITVVASTTSTNSTNTATTECVTTVFDEGSSSTTTPSTQGNDLHHHQTAASSSWQGTMFGFGDVEDHVHMDQWAANHVTSPRKLAASFC